MRRFTLAALSLAISVAALGTYQGSAAKQPPAKTAVDAALRSAIATPTRAPANSARDVYRHPYETLKFFGAKPDMTIVEIWPGGGWYTEILGPLTKDKGALYAAAAGERGHNGVKALMAAQPALYGHIKLAEFPYSSGSKVPDGSADMVLTFRNVHNWRFGGADQTQAAFNQMFAMLKPGGVLGVVEHRLPENMDAALEEKSGYMKVSSVKAFAEAAGFKFDKASEVNANSRDTHDHPGGVWNLPPTFSDKDKDRAKYQAIGESDRMTLRFVKPAR